MESNHSKHHEIISERLQIVKALIAKTEQSCHREHSVKLLAVTKKQSVEAIQVAWSLNQHNFGESFVQEAVYKIQQLADLPDISWHFIGAIQANKTREIATYFQWAHSLDRYKIAKRLNDQRPVHLPPLNVCIQVNVDQEINKSGIDPKDVLAFAEEVAQLPRLHLRGLMAIPIQRTTLIEQRKPFHQLAVLFNALQQIHSEQQIDTLSMGMSNDMEAAIREGATIVRVGSAIFGSRNIN